jgi:alpha-L-rhamnosidase
MGLLKATDWQAKWIADARAAISSTDPHNGYHSELASSPGVAKWVEIDLGSAQPIDAVRLFPARPFDWQPDTPGFLFPLRFKIEVAQNIDFSDAETVVDKTSEDQANPGTNAPNFQFASHIARYVRLTATRLQRRSGNDYGLALAEMEVFSHGRNLARGRPVTALDSIETGAWAKDKLVDGRTQPDPTGTISPPSPGILFHKTFTVPTAIKRATVYATGLGLYELRINGQRVGDHLLTPEWTDYRKRIQYQTYDVTKSLHRGSNAVAAMTGDGWYMGRLMGIAKDAYGANQRLLLQLEIELTDGQILTVATDESWRSTSDGPIRADGIYDGETYDARREIPGWDMPGCDESAWKPVQVVESGPAQLVWQRNEPIRVMEELKPVSMAEPKPGVYVFDFGQNMVGWCRLKVRGPAGSTVTIHHAEMLNEDGTIYSANLRGAPQIDLYTLRGSHKEVFEPHFTYHGFRYVELTGMPERPGLDSVVSSVFHSAAAETGAFNCSHPGINQLMRNIVWTQRGNLMGVPTDCPQRDERFGWMGDIQAFAQTAMFNMDMAAFFSKWIRDIRDDQADDGRFPDYAPHPGNPNTSASGAPGWGDAGVFVPWKVYQNYADRRMLAEHFDSARRWVDYIHHLNPDLIWAHGRNADYNDWLNGDWIKGANWPAKGGSVPQEVFATAYFARSAEIVARMAEVIGRTNDARRYGELAQAIQGAFNKKFVSTDGRIEGDTQGGDALALDFDLLPPDLRAKTARRLVENIHGYQDHLSTGMQTTHRAMLELTRNGYQDVAWKLLTNNAFPSWLYMIDNGATTVWERWDGYVKGRGFQDPGMNSLNHWAFGAVGEWIWRNIAGINPDEMQPGYKHFFIRPRPCPGLTWANASYESIYGRIASDWRIEAGSFRFQVEVPPNTTATIFVPTTDTATVKESGQPAAQAPGVQFRGTADDGSAIFEVQSGRYSFLCKKSGLVQGL